MNVDILILSWHQTYLSSYAGGYIRLKEFLKRIPKENTFILLDNAPTIYRDEIKRDCLIEYHTPRFLLTIRNKLFILWALLETIFASFFLFIKSIKLIRKYKIKLIYVPVGEFPQLYLSAILLRMLFPKTRLVVDILNYELPESTKNYFNNLRKNGVGLFRSLVIITMFYFGLILTNTTLGVIDYIFTVSPELVDRIKRNYKKSTIDFTPSGVNSLPTSLFAYPKKYLGVYVGRMTIQKGIMDVIDVWSYVKKTNPKAKLALAGAVDSVLDVEIRKKIKQLQLTSNIDFFGRVTEEEKFKILSDSQVFLHLAKYEPLFPVIGILEGYAAGCPSIIYKSELISQRELTKNRKFIFQAENGNVLQAAIFINDYIKLSLVDKKILFKESKDYANNFDWGKIAEKEFNVWQKLIKENKNG